MIAPAAVIPTRNAGFDRAGPPKSIRKHACDAGPGSGYTKDMRYDSTSIRSSLAGGCLALALLSTLAVGISAEEPKQAASTEQLAGWLNDLADNEFATRDAAMLNLIDAGRPSIAAIRANIGGRGLEATSRALHVLEQLGLSSDFDVQEEARAALADLAARKEMPQLARRAAGTLAVLTERRSAQAVVELQTLGAHIIYGQDFNGFFAEEYIASVEIDADFRGTEQDLRRLQWLPDVRSLVLAGDKVSNTWLKHAAAMDGLSELHLYEAVVTSEGLAVLAEHPSLSQIGIYYTPIDDAALAHLQKLPALNFVKLYGTPLTREAVEKFQADTGLAKVDHRKGAFLGVGCDNIDGMCLIATVHDHSPAQRAGLQPDDQVIRFGDSKVTDFDSLTAEISTCGVDDEVEVEVKRHGLDDGGNMALQSVTLKVKLGPWERELAVRNGMRP